MKTMKSFLGIAALTALMTSCLSNDDNYQAGFPQLAVKSNYFYANNDKDTLYVTSYGSWQINTTSGANWCKLDRNSGNGMTSYTIPIIFSQNTTESSRDVVFDIFDKEHSDTHVSFKLTQVATRGNGAFGNAALVKKITGSDGSLFEFTYDDYYRPLTVVISKDGTPLRNLEFTYNDYAQTMRVNSQGLQLSATYTNNYQPRDLGGSGDTIVFAEQTYYSLMYAGSASLAFNFEEHHSNGAYQGYGFLQMNAASHPDSINIADSLRYQAKNSQGYVVASENMAFKYSNADNRHQSVDVNQLILGAEQCNPYLLASLYRLCRSSYIVSAATFQNAADNITVAAALNADKSVQKLTVTRHGDSIDYTFEY